MKRLLLALVLLVSLASVARAQQVMEPCALNDNLPAYTGGSDQLNVVLDALAHNYGFTLQVEGDVNLNVPVVAGKLPAATLQARLMSLMKGVPAAELCTGKKFIIFSPQALAARVLQDQTPAQTKGPAEPVVPAITAKQNDTPLPTPVLPKPAMEMPQYQPVACDAQSWVMWLNTTATHEQAEAYRLRSVRPDYNPYLYGDKDCRNLQRPLTLTELNSQVGVAMSPVGYSAGYGYGYGDGYYNPFGIGLTSGSQYGLLKIDGPDAFLRNVRVVIDGRDMAVGSKANNAWNSPILLPAGPHTVEFVREESGHIRAFRREMEITPIAAQYSVFGKAEPTWLRVSGNEFDNAREIYEYQQHRYSEASVK